MSFSMLSFLEEADTKKNVPWDVREFHKDHIILSEGHDGQEIFLIKQGIVHIRTSIQAPNESIQDKNIAKLTEGESFGELSLFDDLERSATAIAASDCEIITVNGPSLLTFINTNPEKGYWLLQYFLKQITCRMRQNNIRANTIMEFYLREHS